MKALVLTEYKKIEFKEVPIPEFGSDEVLINVKAVGICGSDVHGMDGSTGRRIPPINGEYPAVLDLISGGKVNVNEMISAVAPLSEGASWFAGCTTRRKDC